MFPIFNAEIEIRDLKWIFLEIDRFEEFETIKPKGCDFNGLFERFVRIDLEDTDSVYYSYSDSTQYDSCEDDYFWESGFSTVPIEPTNDKTSSIEPKDVWKFDFNPTESSLKRISSSPISKKAIRSRTLKQRDLVQDAIDLYKEYNTFVFQSKLPIIDIVWSSRLLTTAGRTIYIDTQTTIELSTKILDSIEKLRATLAHEVCHVACYYIDKKLGQPHGPHFLAWVEKFKKVYPDLDISICHNYEINFKYYYYCTKKDCGLVYGRHSKSVNLQTTNLHSLLKQFIANFNNIRSFTTFCKSLNVFINDGMFQ